MKEKAINKKKRFIRNLKYTFMNPFTWAWVFVFVVLLIITVVNYNTETEAGIESWWDSIWFSIVTIVAGYYEYSPATVSGRIASLLLLVFGMLVLSAVTGKIASYFMELEQKKEKGLAKLKNMKGQFLLCGWRQGFEKILDYVLLSNPDITTDMIVLVNEATSEQMEQVRNESRFKGINYISGDFSDEATLKRAKIETAARVLIISDQSKKYSQLEIDSRTVLAVITMKNLNPCVYVAAELSDSKFENHLNLAHCDEIILTSDYEYSLLATASSGMGYSNVIRSLIGEDADSGILIEDIPENFIGKTYGEYKKTLEIDKGILIGLLLNTGNFHERRKDALREAQKNPDMKIVVDKLQKVKMLKSNQPVLTPADDFVIQSFTKAIFVKG